MGRPDEQLDMARLPALSNLDSYIRIVKDKATLRKLIFSAQKVIDRCLIGEDEPDAPHVSVISASLAKAKWLTRTRSGRSSSTATWTATCIRSPWSASSAMCAGGLADQPRPTFYADYRQRPVQARVLFVVRAMRRPRRSRRRGGSSPICAPAYRASASDGGLGQLRIVASCCCSWACSGAASARDARGVQRDRVRRHAAAAEIGFASPSAPSRRTCSGWFPAGVHAGVLGIAIRTVAALFVGRLLSGFLFGVTPNDPVAFGGVILVLAVVALVASFVPAACDACGSMTALRNSWAGVAVGNTSGSVSRSGPF